MGGFVGSGPVGWQGAEPRGNDGRNTHRVRFRAWRCQWAAQLARTEGALQPMEPRHRQARGATPSSVWAVRYDRPVSLDAVAPVHLERLKWQHTESAMTPTRRSRTPHSSEPLAAALIGALHRCETGGICRPNICVPCSHGAKVGGLCICLIREHLHGPPQSRTRPRQLMSRASSPFTVVLVGQFLPSTSFGKAVSKFIAFSVDKASKTPDDYNAILRHRQSLIGVLGGTMKSSASAVADVAVRGCRRMKEFDL
jgi:hypothetical protein